MSSAAPEDGLSEAFRDDKRQRSVDLGQRSVDFVVRQRSVDLADESRCMAFCLILAGFGSPLFLCPSLA